MHVLSLGLQCADKDARKTHSFRGKTLDPFFRFIHLSNSHVVYPFKAGFKDVFATELDIVHR
jgi:hypothetical protein